MNNLFKFGIVVASLAALMTSAVAAGPVLGVWHGRVSFNTTKLLKGASPNEQKLMAAQLKAQEQIKLTLTVRGDHTLSIIAIGGPKPIPPVNGTWSQAGNTFSITLSKDGKQGKPKAFGLAKDTKSLTYTESGITMSFYR